MCDQNDIDNKDGQDEKVEKTTSNCFKRKRSENGLSRKPLLVLINPHSGRGKSVNIFNKCILPILELNSIDHEVFITKPDRRVKDYLLEKNLTELTSFKSILIVSGDGLLHETINALMNRPDWRLALEIPVGIVPTGSGNGMAYTLLKQLQPNIDDQQEAIELCCKKAIQDQICYSDLVKVVYGQNSTIWSFLSIGWGLMADIDIDSEWLRLLGEWRFTIYGLLRSITSVSYKGRLSYKRAKTDKHVDHEASENMLSTKNEISHEDTSDGWTHIEDRFACLYAVHQAYISRKTNFAPKSTLTDQMMYLTFVRGKLSPCQVVEFLLAIDDGSHEKLPYVDVIPVTSFTLEPLETSKLVVDGEVIPWKMADGPIVAEVVPKLMKISWTSQES